MRDARLVMFCFECRTNMVMRRERYTGACPKCGTPMRMMRCSRCGHEWLPRTWGRELPNVCPKCKSKYWNRERTLGVKE